MGTRTKRIVISVIAILLLVGCIFFLVYAAKYASSVLFEIEESSAAAETTETVDTAETSDTAKASLVMPDITDWNYLNAQDKLIEFFRENSLDITIVVEWCANTDPDKNFYVKETDPKAGETLVTDVKEITLIVFKGCDLPETSTEETTSSEATTKATEPSKTIETTKSTEASKETDPTVETTTETTAEPTKVPQKTIKMPDVTGKNYKDAQDELKKFFKDNGLNITITVGWGHNSDPNKNLKVICTSPAAGDTIGSSTDTVIMMVYEGYNPPVVTSETT